MSANSRPAEDLPDAAPEEPPGRVEPPSFGSSSSTSERPVHDDDNAGLAASIGHPFGGGGCGVACHGDELDADDAPGWDSDAVGLGAALRARRRPNLDTRAHQFRRQHYPQTTLRQWNDWRWQLAARVRTLAELERFLVLSAEEREALEQSGELLPFAVTPYYLSLLDPNDATQPLRRSIIPTKAELQRSPGEADDPLGEEGQSVIPGLVHRYPDRALLLVHDFCSTYCRYCTRSRVVGAGRIKPSLSRLARAVEYIRQTPAIRDVLVSGGDPLTLGDDKLEWLLASLRAIPHVEVIRIGTKVPVVMPQRITQRLVGMLRRYHPLWMSIHFTHPDELTPETEAATRRLADAGIPLGSQTVLLKGINDDVDVMKRLMRGLMRFRVRPYYIYQCDPIPGSAHFRTHVSKGLEIIKGLRGHTSGYAVPTFVIDAPGGGGKIPLMPKYEQGHDANGDLLLRNYQDREFRYPDGCCDGE